MAHPPWRDLSLPALVCAWRYDDTLTGVRDVLKRLAQQCRAESFETLFARGTLPPTRAGVDGAPCTVPLPWVVDDAGCSLLHLLAMEDGAWREGAAAARRAIAALVALGCDVNARDLTGTTPLIRFAHKACEKLLTAVGPPNLLPLLAAWLDAGAAPGAVDAGGFSAGAHLKRAHAGAAEPAEQDALCAALIELQRRAATAAAAPAPPPAPTAGAAGGGAPPSPAPAAASPLAGLRGMLSPWERLQRARGGAGACAPPSPLPPAEPPRALLAEDALGAGALAKLYFAVLLLDRRPLGVSGAGGCGDGARRTPALEPRWVAGRGTDAEFLSALPLKLLATAAPDAEAAPAAALGPCASLEGARALCRAVRAAMVDAAGAGGCLAGCGCDGAVAAGGTPPTASDAPPPPSHRAPQLQVDLELRLAARPSHRAPPPARPALSCDFHAVAVAALLGPSGGTRGGGGAGATARARAAAALAGDGFSLPPRFLLLPAGAALQGRTRATLPPPSAPNEGGGEEQLCAADDSRALLGAANPRGALPLGLGSPPRPGNPREGALGGGVRKALSFVAAGDQLAAAVAALSV
jgi:hypothetical protein